MPAHGADVPSDAGSVGMLSISGQGRQNQGTLAWNQILRRTNENGEGE